MIGRLRDLVLALLAGGLVAWGAVVGYGAVTDVRKPEPLAVGDRVQQAADALRAGDRVYVASDAHDRISPADEQTLEQLADTSPNPVYVVVWERGGQAGYGGEYDAVYQLERLVDRDGVYVVWSGTGHGIVHERGDDRLEPAPVEDFYGDPMLRLSEILASVDAGTLTHDDWDYWGGPGGATAAGLLFAAVALPVTLVLVGLGRMVAHRRFRMQGGWW